MIPCVNHISIGCHFSNKSPKIYIHSECSLFLSDFHNIIGRQQNDLLVKKAAHHTLSKLQEFYRIRLPRWPCICAISCNGYLRWHDVCTSSLIKYVVDHRAPVKSKTVSSQSVPYMNSVLQKFQYRKNMKRKKFKKNRKSCWEENRRLKKFIIKFRKYSMRKYFEERCSKQDKKIWKTISPLFPDKKFKNGNHIALSENNNIINDQHGVAEIFNEYFSTAAMSVGFEDCVKSATDAINKHCSHPSVIKIQENSNPENVHTQQESLALKWIISRKATGYDNLPGKMIRIGSAKLSYPLTHLINTSISLKYFPCAMKYV